MEKQIDYSKCRECKFFVEDDDTLKHPISYCILLGINIDSSGACPEFVSLDEEITVNDCDADPEPVV